MSNANTFSYLALISFVPLSIVAFLIWRPALAIAGVFLAAQFYLPERVEFDVVGLPAFTKYTAPVFCSLLACMLIYRHKLLDAHLLRWLMPLSIVVVFSSIGTVLTNSDTLNYGDVELPGLRAWDIISLAFDDMLTFIFPFIFGSLFYRTTRELIDLLRVLVLFAVIYSPFIILEIALSPQFHNWIYGFYPHMFGQSYRYGGYRPSVFMIHGIVLAAFICGASLAALGLGRTRTPVFGFPAVLLGLMLAVILLVCKSIAAIIYLIALAPLINFSSPKTQLRVALILGLFVLSFPILRATDLVPTEELVQFAKTLDEDRGSSLAHRFENDDILLDKALERPVFGWGAYGRNRTVADAGAIRKDGFWIGQLGTRGIVGFAVAFGLLLLPVFIAAHNLKEMIEKKRRILIGSLALIVVMLSVNFIPNGMLNPVPFFLAGALAALSTVVVPHRFAVKQVSADRLNLSEQHTQLAKDGQVASDKRPT